MALNAINKLKNPGGTVQTLQASMNIQGPGGKPGAGTRKQSLPESMRTGATWTRKAPPIGKNHVRKTMGLE